MADPVLDAIDNKKEELSSYQKFTKGYKQSLEEGLVVPFEQYLQFAKETASALENPYTNALMWGAGQALSATSDLLDPVLQQFDRPQNAFQGMLSEGMSGLSKGWGQEQDYTYRDLLSPEFSQKYPNISSLTSGAAEMFLDPTVLAGGTLRKLGTKVIPDSNMEGNWSAGAPNYIEGYYADPTPDIKPTKLERAVIGPVLNRQGINPTDTRIQTAARKGKGLAKWLGQSTMNALVDTFYPPSRALYGETGINRSSQRRVENLVEKGSGRDIQKAVAQAIYNSYIPLQTRRTGPLAPELQAISDYSNVQNSKKMSLETFIEGADKTSFSFTDGNKTRKVNTPKKDIEFAYEYIKQAWGLDPENTSILFKKPTGSSGNHLNDLAKSSPLNAKVRQVFIDFEKNKVKPSVSSLFDALSEEANRISAKNERLPKNSPSREKGFKVLNPDAEHAKKNGLWLQSSFVGDAVVEGGVNVITKVLPSGRAISFISDVHDFLEKAPVVGTALGKLFPETNLAVVGPLHQDIMGTKWASKAKEKAGLSEDTNRRQFSLDTDPSRRGSKEVLEDYINVRPSNLGVAAEIAKMTGTGMMTGGLAQNLQDTFQEPQ